MYNVPGRNDCPVQATKENRISTIVFSIVCFTPMFFNVFYDVRDINPLPMQLKSKCSSQKCCDLIMVYNRSVVNSFVCVFYT